MGTAGEGHRRLPFLALRLLRLQRLLQRLCIGGELEVGVLGGDRDGLTIQIQASEDVHRQRLVVLRYLAGRDQVRHRRQDVSAVDAVGGRSQPQVVPQGAPGRLLGHLHIGHAMLGEEALLLGDDQRRCVGERDVTENCLADLRPRRGGMHAGRKRRPDRSEQRGRTADSENVAPRNRHRHSSCRYSSLTRWSRRSGKKEPLRHPCRTEAASAALLFIPFVSGSGSVVGATRQLIASAMPEATLSFFQ